MARSLQVAEDLEIPKMRCASFHSSLGVDAAGTAGAYDVFLCVEVPLPWGRDISTSEPFLSLFGAGTASFTAADGRVVRPQGLVPRPGAEGWTRVLHLERRGVDTDGPGPAAPYRRREWWVGADEVLELCHALVDVDEEVLARYEERRVEVPDEVVDLFVCTHGKRDACCGSTGAALHEQLRDRLAVVDPDRSRVRLWRVSHTGGHRFAPTALSFPDGYAWAHLNAEQALGLALRTAGPEESAGHCRGVASLPAGPAQVADVALLDHVGWSWADAHRRATVTAFDRSSMTTGVRMAADLGGGRHVEFQVTVELAGHVPQITCGSIEGPEYAVEPVWRAVSITPV